MKEFFRDLPYYSTLAVLPQFLARIEKVLFWYNPQWSAVTLLRNPIPGQGYISRLTGKDKGLTFSHPLEQVATNYSNILETTILSCILEKSANRPSLKELTAIIKAEMIKPRRGTKDDFDFVIELEPKALEAKAKERKDKKAAVEGGMRGRGRRERGRRWEWWKDSEDEVCAEWAGGVCGVWRRWRRGRIWSMMRNRILRFSAS